MAAQIAELQREHITLLAEAQRLSTELVRCTLTTCTGDLWMRMLEFFGNLEKHSHHEDVLLLQFLD